MTLNSASPGFPSWKINTKSVAEFIRRQEALSTRNVTDQGLSIRQQSLSDSQPPAPKLPDELPHTSRSQEQYEVTLSLADTRRLKKRESLVVCLHPPPSQSCFVPLCQLSHHPVAPLCHRCLSTLPHVVADQKGDHSGTATVKVHI